MTFCFRKEPDMSKPIKQIDPWHFLRRRIKGLLPAWILYVKIDGEEESTRSPLRAYSDGSAKSLALREMRQIVTGIKTNPTVDFLLERVGRPKNNMTHLPNPAYGPKKEFHCRQLVKLFNPEAVFVRVR